MTLKLRGIFPLLFLVLIITGCGTGAVKSGNSPEKAFENKPEDIAENEHFSFKLHSKKAVYQVGEPLEIQAELTYIGDLESITIAHAASPIWMLTTNLTEDYQFEAAMNEPLILTTLTTDVPFIQEYQFSGSTYYEGAPGKPYSEQVFEKMVEGNFPPGQYEIRGKTDFAIGENPMTDKIQIESSIIFTVIE